MVADSPGNVAFFRGRALLVCLAVDARIADVRTTNCAVFDFDLPSPHCDCVPLFYFESSDLFHLFK